MRKLNVIFPVSWLTIMSALINWLINGTSRFSRKRSFVNNSFLRHRHLKRFQNAWSFLLERIGSKTWPSMRNWNFPCVVPYLNFNVTVIGIHIRWNNGCYYVVLDTLWCLLLLFCNWIPMIYVWCTNWMSPAIYAETWSCTLAATFNYRWGLLVAGLFDFESLRV